MEPEQTPSDSPGATLFKASELAPTGISGRTFDVATDGQRFMLKREVGTSPVHVILNWDSRLRLVAG